MLGKNNVFRIINPFLLLFGLNEGGEEKVNFPIVEWERIQKERASKSNKGKFCKDRL